MLIYHLLLGDNSLITLSSLKQSLSHFYFNPKKCNFPLDFFYVFPKEMKCLLTLSWRRSLSYRNQSINLQGKFLNLQLNAFHPPYRIYSRILSIGFPARCALLKTFQLKIQKHSSHNHYFNKKCNIVDL